MELQKAAVEVDFHWEVEVEQSLEQSLERSLEHLELAVEQRRRRPYIAGSTERTQHNHLNKSISCMEIGYSSLP